MFWGNAQLFSASTHVFCKDCISYKGAQTFLEGVQLNEKSETSDSWYLGLASWSWVHEILNAQSTDLFLSDIHTSWTLWKLTPLRSIRELNSQGNLLVLRLETGRYKRRKLSWRQALAARVFRQTRLGLKFNCNGIIFKRLTCPCRSGSLWQIFTQ